MMDIILENIFLLLLSSLISVQLLEGLILVDKLIDEFLINHVDKAPFFPEWSGIFFSEEADYLLFYSWVKEEG